MLILDPSVKFFGHTVAPKCKNIPYFQGRNIPFSVETFNKEFLCITHTVEHNYISPGSTVGIQLHVAALYVGHLQVVI